MKTKSIVSISNEDTLRSVVYRMRVWERISILSSKSNLSPEEQEELYVLQYKFEELTKN